MKDYKIIQNHKMYIMILKIQIKSSNRFVITEKNISLSEKWLFTTLVIISSSSSNFIWCVKLCVCGGGDRKWSEDIEPLISCCSRENLGTRRNSGTRSISAVVHISAASAVSGKVSVTFSELEDKPKCRAQCVVPDCTERLSLNHRCSDLTARSGPVLLEHASEMFL